MHKRTLKENQIWESRSSRGHSRHIYMMSEDREVKNVRVWYDSNYWGSGSCTYQVFMKWVSDYNARVVPERKADEEYTYWR